MNCYIINSVSKIYLQQRFMHTSPPLYYTQGDICELGRVLMQGSFSVWISHKKGPTRMKEMARFKPMQRHLFLYERALLLCKRREEHGDGCDKTPSYSFKHCLKVCLILSNAIVFWKSGHYN